jgi:hypothetical protein
VAVGCSEGTSVRLDCAQLGQVCEFGACANDTQCGNDYVSECDGDVLLANCLSGRIVDIDCGALGATCGSLSSDWLGCVFPETAEQATDDDSSSEETDVEADAGTNVETDTETDVETDTDVEPDATNCAETTEQNAAMSAELGCDLDVDFMDNCEGLYAQGGCVAQWESLIDCFGTFSADEFYCNEDNALKPKPEACTAEREAFDACIR